MFRDLVLKNRSYRGFDESHPVTYDQLKELVSLARITPATANRQPLRYVLSADSTTNGKIFPHTKWAASLNLPLPYEGHRPTGYIVLCIDTNLMPSCDKDVGIVAQTILLGAVEMGLGGCMIASFQAKEIQDKLKLSPQYQPVLVIALGKPEETIVLEDSVNGNVRYYRDAQGVHHVPKRPLEELILD